VIKSKNFLPYLISKKADKYDIFFRK